MSSNKIKVLGVCGGIGSGKSTACQLMVDSLGCVARIGKRFFDTHVYMDNHVNHHLYVKLPNTLPYVKMPTN